MSGSPDMALLAAVRLAVLADPAVKSALGDPVRLYDERPTDPVYPFATFGRIETRPAAAAGAEALEHTANLHVWSRHGGRAEALEIVGALRAALDDARPAVAGRRLVLLFATYTDVFRADAFTMHGVLRLRAITEPQA